ncbi:MAG: hypothetical protein IJA08_06660 [Clostridia bacterium]|nr:hypothetical protein [Clostridia bacterium]
MWDKYTLKMMWDVNVRGKKFIDVTGIPLTPSRNGKRCLGNGEYPGYEICCDECDYYLYCFKEYRKIVKKGFAKRRKELKKKNRRTQA